MKHYVEHIVFDEKDNIHIVASFTTYFRAGALLAKDFNNEIFPKGSYTIQTKTDVDPCISSLAKCFK